MSTGVVSGNIPVVDGPVRAKRVKTPACVACKVSHLSCEEERPCSRCRSRGIECQMGERKWRRGPRGAPARKPHDADIDEAELEARAAAEVLATNSLTKSRHSDHVRRFSVPTVSPSMSRAASGHAFGGMAYSVQSQSQYLADNIPPGQYPSGLMMRHMSSGLPTSVSQSPVSETNDHLHLQDLINMISGNDDGVLARFMDITHDDLQSSSAANYGQRRQSVIPTKSANSGTSNKPALPNTQGPQRLSMDTMDRIAAERRTVYARTEQQVKDQLTNKFQSAAAMKKIKGEIVRLFHALAKRLRKVPDASTKIRELQAETKIFWDSVMPRILSRPLHIPAVLEAESQRLYNVGQGFKDLDLPTLVTNNMDMITFANIAFCEMVGKSRSSFENQQQVIFDYIHDDDIILWIRNQISTLGVMSGKHSYRMPIKVINKSAENEYVECILTVSFIRSLTFGDFTGAVAIFTPISDEF